MQPSASADKTRLKAKDKSKEWKEGSVWEGTVKSKFPNGAVQTGSLTLEITKRDGKSFKGWAGKDDNHCGLFEGDVEANGDMKFTIKKLLREGQEYEEWLKRGNGRNMVGLAISGTVDGKSVSLKAVQPDPDHPKNARIIRTWKFKLKTDD